MFSPAPPGLPPAMQKVMYKGLLPEDKTLREIKVTNGAKIMVVGSTINDVLAVNTPKEVIQQEVKAEENKKEPLCRQKVRPDTLPTGWSKIKMNVMLFHLHCFYFSNTGKFWTRVNQTT